jgi:hypothetical protein
MVSHRDVILSNAPQVRLIEGHREAKAVSRSTELVEVGPEASRGGATY